MDNKGKPVLCLHVGGQARLTCPPAQRLHHCSPFLYILLTCHPQVCSFLLLSPAFSLPEELPLAFRGFFLFVHHQILLILPPEKIHFPPSPHPSPSPESLARDLPHSVVAYSRVIFYKHKLDNISPSASQCP